MIRKTDLFSKTAQTTPNCVALHYADTIEVAALCVGIVSYQAYYDSLPPMRNRKEHIGTSADRWAGGALIVAIAATQSLNRVIDWKEWDNGVFVYEHCDAAAGEPSLYDNLPAWLITNIDDDAWLDISENWKSPTDEAMDALIVEWAQKVGVPVKQPQDNSRA